MTTTLRWHGYRYMPYERRLAALEVARLANSDPQPIAEGLSVKADLRFEVARRLTYFAEVVNASGVTVRTDQATFEASAPRNGIKRASGDGAVSMKAITKQATRYSAHGLHEYRGKFNPQIVRATANILGLKPGSLILDPFCGSGTVLLEAAHLGLDAAGFDLHPLAVEIANAKVTAFHTPRDQMRRCVDAVLAAVAPALEVDERKLGQWIEKRLTVPFQEALPNFAYLREWFPELVLKQVAFALEVILREVPASLQRTFRVMLSDVVRDVSWQEPADLRIRRRAVQADNYPALSLFAEGIQRKASAICAAPANTDPARLQAAMLVDSRKVADSSEALRGLFGRRKADAIISSPPYATALPYVDMHRLSLCLLGLIGDREIRETERALIGNREITDRERRAIETELRVNALKLPKACHALCVRMLVEAEKPGNGFRRRNTPSLLYKYLGEMQTMFRTATALLKRGAPLAFVIGPNRCSLGGSDFAIDTPELLREVAEASGFVQDECIELDAYQRYDLHQQNSIRREVLLVLRTR